MKKICRALKKEKKVITGVFLILVLCTSCGVNNAEVAGVEPAETTVTSATENTETVTAPATGKAEETTSVSQEGSTEQRPEETAPEETEESTTEESTAAPVSLESDLSYLFENGVPAPGNNFYLIEGSDSRFITREEVKDFNAGKLETAIAEIYARKGYIPESYPLRTYFVCQQWYKPETAELNSIVLNEYEQENIRMLEEQKEQAEQKEEEQTGSIGESVKGRFRKLVRGTDYETEIISKDPDKGLIKHGSGEGQRNVLITEKSVNEFFAERLRGIDLYEFVTDGGYYLLISGNINAYDGDEVYLLEVRDGECVVAGAAGGTMEYIFDDMFCVCREYEMSRIYQYTWYRFDGGKMAACGESLIRNTKAPENGNSILMPTPGYMEEQGKMVRKVLDTEDRIRVISLDLRGMSDKEQPTKYWKVLVNDEYEAYIPAKYVANGFGDSYCEDGIEAFMHSDADEFHY